MRKLFHMRVLTLFNNPMPRIVGLWMFVLALAGGSLPILPSPSGELASFEALVHYICTPAGMQRLDDVGSEAPRQAPTQTHAQLCLFCSPLTHPGSGLLAAAPVLPATPPVVSVIPDAPPTSLPWVARAYRPQDPRGPPSTFKIA